MCSSFERILAEKVMALGKVALIARSDGKFFVRLENRRNDTKYEIPAKDVEKWKQELR